MNPKRNQRAYLEAALREATPVELIIILHDILARDLQAAIAAMEAGDIEARCKELKHGFLVLAQLEGALNKEEGDEVAEKLSCFYAMARGQMLKAQMERDSKILGQLAGFVGDVRQAWMEVNSRQRPAEGSSESSFPRAQAANELPATAASSWKA
jgi:flagellar protein FliS